MLVHIGYRDDTKCKTLPKSLDLFSGLDYVSAVARIVSKIWQMKWHCAPNGIPVPNLHVKLINYQNDLNESPWFQQHKLDPNHQVLMVSDENQWTPDGIIFFIQLTDDII